MRLAVAVLALLLAFPAHAEDSEARRHYDRGLISYNLQRYTEALEHFQAAYELHPDPAFLFNIGQCQRLLGQRESAARSYRAYLSQLPDAPNREQARRFIAELSQPAAAPPPAPAPAPPAERVVLISVPPQPSPPPVADTASPWYRSAPGWGLVGSGVAVLAVGGALLGYGTTLQSQAGDARTVAERENDTNTSTNLRLSGGILLGVGGLLTIGGATVFGVVAARHRRH